MSRVVITGANGFVGQWLLKELQKQDVEVFAVVKDKQEDISMLKRYSNVTIIYCDLSELKALPDLINKRGFDAFYHLAWVAAGGPNRAKYDIQIKNVEYCCDAVNVAKVLESNSILFAGTISEKLVNDQIEKKKEVASNEIYAICKKFAHILTIVQGKSVGIRTIWMEFANLYGPLSINGNIVGYTIKNLLNETEANFGPADQTYDLLYIEDLVKGVSLLGSSETAQGTFYIGSGHPRKLSSYLCEIGEICGKPNLINIGARPDDGTRYDDSWFSIEKLKSIVNYNPQITFKDGIEKTKEWIKNNQF
ncbi:MAG: NAD(P)-dependent oxidoreductase [Muribaculaceae bacterium]|nr:NAD(P)-dependent oxidoreductase [Muribaculaceae bacterium]